MPIIHHKKPPETPWRPNYHMWDITRPGDGTTNSSLSYSEVGIGVGPPLHTHESDELIVVLEGTLEARLGDEISMVGADHTVVVPPNVNMMRSQGWGVCGSQMMPLYSQYGTAYPGAVAGSPVRFLTRPAAPSNTQQFGYYYIRGPW